MGDDPYKQYANIPIPTYDEATSSRPASSQQQRGPQEVSDDAERQGLLEEGNGGDGNGNRNRNRYQPPTVESARSSVDTLDGVQVGDEADEDDGHRTIEEMDYLDPPDTSRRSPRLYHRARLREARTKWSQQLSNLSSTLSSIRLPGFRSLYSPVQASDNTTSPPSTPTPSTPAPTTPWRTRLTSSLSIPEQYRVSAPTLARLFGLFILMTFVYVLFAFDMFPGHGRLRGGAHFDPESVRSFVQQNLDSKNIEGYLAHITSFDHVAGTEGDYYLAKWMEEQWGETGALDQLAIVPYYVYLNYPGQRSVKIIGKDGEKQKEIWKAKLDEEKVYPDRQQTKAWLGHSKSGKAEGHLIYANGGSREDFAWLREQGVVTKGAIALVKYGGTEGDRSLKVMAAEEAECAGVLIYSDPGDVAEDSEWQPTDDALQRGSVSRTNLIIGDPLTPGFASTLDSNRESKEESLALPKIPSLPLAWRDASHLLKSLKKHGTKVAPDWIHGPKDFDLKWYTGNASSENPIVALKNENDENPLQQIWNVHGMIEGLEEPEAKIIVGNHRDAWCFGAVDPGSGSAVLMELVRMFGELRKLGWRPLRTIEFVSWDAEEYGFIGSTEYVEDHINYLRDNAVAYLNVDDGVFGSQFKAQGSPVWSKALLHVLNRIKDPKGEATLKQLWEQHGSNLDILGAGSDYVPFQTLAGTSSIDFGFAALSGPTDGESQAYYPYHSCYETLEWMQTHGDPGGFPYHRALAEVWALLILEVADRPLIPFDLRVYAESLNEYVTALEREAASAYATLEKLPHASAGDLFDAHNVTVQPLKDALAKLQPQIEEFHQFEDLWTTRVLGAGGFETTQYALRRLEYNDRLAHFEADLLDVEEGYPDGRAQFKHVVFGPRKWGGYQGSSFPAIRDAVAEGQWEVVKRLIGRAAERIEVAGRKLVK
ncbi:glutamate carboxypeptidase 2 [Hortaea werneckii]|uniref:Peptidase M28 domain-containing protein n=2 Tax=Hortaea werneckii TaxID=91943 RepID=A0A3M7I2H5_HORWE|nr:glutamate carboxypeptidase 2 [Hortaea werneckii]OTA28776.1 hypothetical protein BTJ68_09864 [Hortaea werneckii EXF-2000]KAI6819536.1 glutamate carboxypeptidase 2 [Hortaea werneckii]KAI6842870.1 glutamate carboxypeptidase 2 [Hortaea werneckii]KAI6903780.1 glutamate carboxypeptidase 2 [Hortaea werneckii]